VFLSSNVLRHGRLEGKTHLKKGTGGKCCVEVEDGAEMASQCAR